MKPARIRPSINPLDSDSVHLKLVHTGRYNNRVHLFSSYFRNYTLVSVRK